MRTPYAVLLMFVAMSFTAAAAEPAPVPSTAVKPVQSVQAAPGASKSPLSQQDKMRECNKQATGKKGAERKAFMKSCLSRKV